MDQYASRANDIDLSAGDSVSVILTLYPLNQAEPAFSLSTLHKMGLPSHIARDLN